MKIMQRQLSTKFNFMYRWVIPGLLSIVAILIVWRGGAAGLGEDADAGVALIAFAVAVLLMVIARWFDRGKGVWLDGDALLVSDRRRESRIDLANIESVAATQFVKPDRVRIRFKQPTVFGDTIVFFPPARWLNWAAQHPVADELATLADAPRQS